VGVTVLERDRGLVVRVVPVNDEDAGQGLLSEDTFRDRGRSGVLEEEDAQRGGAEEPRIPVLPVVSPAGFVSVFDARPPVGLLQRRHGGSEVSREAVKDIDERAQGDARHLRHPAHGYAVDIMHDGDLCGDFVAVKALRQHRRRLCPPLFPTVLAYLVVEAVEELFRPREEGFYHRAVSCSLLDERTAAVRTDVSHVSLDDSVGGLFGVGRSAVAGAAGYGAPLLLPVLFRRCFFERSSRRGGRGAEVSFLFLSFPVAELCFQSSVLFNELVDAELFFETALTLRHRAPFRSLSPEDGRRRL